MFGDKFNFGALLKNAKKMQQMMEDTQGELAKIEVSGEAGGGAVKVTLTARHDVKNVSIDDDILKEDKKILEDLIAAAFNDAAHKVEKITKEKMMDASKLFGGMTDSEQEEK